LAAPQNVIFIEYNHYTMPLPTLYGTGLLVAALA
jgi:hypothetical protein